MLWDVLTGLVYSVAGFMGGFTVGRLTREVHEIRETVMPDTFARKDSDGSQHATKLGVAIIILSLLTVISAAFTAVQAKRQAQCQRDYNARFVEAFQARARAADADRAALNTMIIRIANQKSTPAERKRVVAEYVQSIEAGDAARKAHPLPQPPDPRDLCSD